MIAAPIGGAGGAIGACPSVAHFDGPAIVTADVADAFPPIDAPFRSLRLDMPGMKQT
ncbi:hypothetical protein [Paracoccus denitrificans]|uniref:hypothetical protein n=1 Tax=Paracoccus denitrificans TaxID=266 RepID=UPI00131A2FE0|nr:hypothetical protein [Paracoccus denitrificans]